jgi:hypothetical protein
VLMADHRPDQDVPLALAAVLVGLFAAGYAQWFLAELPQRFEPKDITRRPGLR